MAKKIIGVIGQGFVGGALTQVMSRYYDVWVYDKKKK
jgi:3-hydroxyacyl-CoA dehydrogenase